MTTKSLTFFFLKNFSFLKSIISTTKIDFIVSKKFQSRAGIFYMNGNINENNGWLRFFSNPFDVLCTRLFRNYKHI